MQFTLSEIIQMLTIAATTGGVLWMVWDTRREVRDMRRVVLNGMRTTLLKVESEVKHLPCVVRKGHIEDYDEWDRA